MLVNVPKSHATKLSQHLQNDFITVLGCKVGKLSVTYKVDAPDFFKFPDWVTIL